MRVLIDLDILKHTLSKGFERTIKARGRSIYNKNKIKRAVHRLDRHIYEFLIEGTKMYDLEIRYSDYTIESMRCTCPYNGSCKHEAAALYYLQNAAKEELKLKPKSKSRPKRVTINTGEFRPVFKRESTSKRSDIKVLKPHVIVSFEEYKVEHQLLEGNTIKSIFIPDKSIYYYRYRLIKEMDGWTEIALKDDMVISRCTYCNEPLKTLCDHQFHMLVHLINILKDDWSPIRINYQRAVELFSNQSGKSRQLIQRMYEVLLDQDTYLLKKIHKGYLADAKMAKKAIEQIGGMLTVDPPVDEDHFLVRTTKTKEQNWENGLVWPQDIRTSITKPYIVKAKANKAGTKLLSRFEWVEQADYSDPDQSLFYTDLLESFRLHEGEPRMVLISNVLSTLDNQTENLINGYHMLHKDGHRSTPYEYGEKFRKRDLMPFNFSREKARIIANVTEDDELFYLKVNVKLGEIKVELSPGLLDLTMSGLMIIFNDIGYLYNSAEDSHLANAFNRSESLIFDVSTIDSLRDLVRQLQAKIEVNYPDQLFTRVEQMKVGKKQIYLSEVGRFILFTPYIYYKKNIKFHLLKNRFIGSGIKKEHLYVPDEDQLTSFKSWIADAHDNFGSPYHALDYYFLDIDQVVDEGWFFNFFESAREEGVEIFGQENLTRFKYNTNTAKIQSRISSGIDWFDVDVKVEFGKQTVPLKDWVEAVKTGNKFVKLGDGTLGILPDKWFADLKKLAQIAEVNKNKMQLSKLHFNVVDQLFDEISDLDVLKEIQKKKKRLQSFESINKYPIPSTVTATLRPYQEQGFQWLKFLDEFTFGGCLADDMGLGKTLQVISLLMDRIGKAKRSRHLVVVPRSLLFNWEDELLKFAPSAKFVIHHGTDRSTKKTELNKYNIIITTYGTATNDIELLQSLKLDYVVLDESQAIKNPASKRYKAMRLLKSRNRVVMTGTPIENNTFDLYAQFSFLNPGIFGGQKKFKEQFSDPIDGANDKEARDMLSALIHPFLLRRTKEQVASDLPEKTESVLYCEMTTEQRKYYEALKMDIKMGLESKIESDGLNKSKFMILDGLLKLRQVCNSPQLVDKTLAGKRNISSKIDLLLEQIENNIGNHSALVFSQFVTMLTLIRAELDKRKIKYAYLDGSTRDRKQAVADFNDHDDCKVFLISIKAGNTGLNLVKADYVYVVDPWWNPAVEAQAIDRTHRIGQDKNVMAYRLICKDSIEEKIVELQQKKKKLASDIIRTDESVFKSLNKSDLMALFD